MHKTAFVFIVVCLLASVPGLSQTWDEVCSNGDYIWGEGWGRTIEEADREALASLGSHITIAVSSSFIHTEDQRISSSGKDYASVTNSYLSLQSFTRLSNTYRIVLREGRRCHVGRWVRRDALETLFSDRRARALEYESMAEQAERELRLDAALRYHYWAYATLGSLSRPSEVRDANGRMLVVTIPERMNEIFSGLTVGAKKTGNTLTLDFSYKGFPVRGLDFTLFDGQRWSGPIHVRDGHASVKLPAGALGEIIQLRVEYAYIEEARLDDELGAVMASAEGRPFRKSNIIFRRDWR